MLQASMPFPIYPKVPLFQKQKDMSIIVKKGNVSIQNYVQAGATLTQNFNAPVYIGDAQPNVEDDEQLSLEPENVKRAIDLLMKDNQKQNKRWWFAPYVVLRDHRVVTNLNAFEAYLTELYQGQLPVPIDTHDLSKEVELGCFAKPFETWTPDKSPVSEAAFKRYCTLVELVLDILKDQSAQ